MNPWLLLKTSLLIYQQEDYSLTRWWQWWQRNVFAVIKQPKVTLKVTQRIRLIIMFGFIIVLLFGIGLYVTNLLWLGFLLVLMGIFPSLLMILGIGVTWPLQILVERKRVEQIKQAIKLHSKLIKIGITGSYGKTSVKEILFEILDRYEYTLMSPDNFNTIGGLQRVLQHELSSKHQYFLCEMGAYQPGDIAELCELVKPQWGMITAVGPQHLERFGQIEAIARTKTEMARSVPGKKTVVNWDSPPLKTYVLEHALLDRVIRVSRENKEVECFISNVIMNREGISFTLVFEEKVWELKAPLFGSASVVNCALAAAMSISLGIPKKVIKAGLQQALPSPHRLEIKPLNKAVLLDNTYSSNFDSFMMLLEDIKKTEGKKVLVTPGIVELGEQESEYHQKMGAASALVFDEVILVGESLKTKSFHKGLQQRNFSGKITFIANNYTAYWDSVHELSCRFDWIVLENDLPERFS
jgi:UDP-N-acetylmuramoyl-tripeptide--D-alanyl-D-alanine ligase